MVLVAVAAPIGCGSSDEVSDDEIIDALKLVRSEESEAYNIGADPFCGVELNLLNSEEEVDAARDSDGELVIASSNGKVGVRGVPPFAPDCAKKARRGLNSLE